MSKQPNLLILLSDQHHPKVLGGAGDEVVETPNLDALAREGVSFDHCYCGSPLCVPSRMSFMTSRHCSQIGVWSNNCILASDIPTFAHSLGAMGYETVLCGRMHFEGPDQMHGFERRIMEDFTRNLPGMPGVTLEGLPAGTGQTRNVVERATHGRSSIHAYDEAVTEAACEFISGRRSGDRPWCMVVGYYLPHSPFICPKDLFDYYYDKVTMPPAPPQDAPPDHPAVVAWRQQRKLEEAVSEEQIRAARAAYYGMVTLLDRNAGKVLSTLNDSQHADQTVRAYLSDHGEMAGEHGMWWKSNFYEGSVRVPMIWSWPGHWPADERRSQIVSLLDVGPTLAGLAGEPMRHPVSGNDLSPILQSGGQTQAWDRPTFSEMTDARMIRSGPWKLTAYHGYDNPQLFHLDQDPEEFYDLGADPAFAQVRQELLRQVHEGWNPQQTQEVLTRRHEDLETLVSWAGAVQPEQPFVWQAPEGVNQVPEASRET